MKTEAAIIVLISLILTACTQHTPSDKTPVVGEAVDSVAIANDTVQQENIEGSYEYAQTIIVSPKLAYDVRGYGGPTSRGQYCILRRGIDNKADTVVQGERIGIIINAFTADLNKNGQEEIYVVTRKTGKGEASNVVAFEFNSSGKMTPLVFGDPNRTFTINTPVPYDTIRPNSDTIFADGDMLMKYYKHDNKYSPDLLNHGWKLRNKVFELMHND